MIEVSDREDPDNDRGLARDRLGMSGRLMLAFAALAALTLSASIIATLNFGTIGQAVSDVTERAVPRMAISLRLAAVSAEISAAAPRINAVETQAARVEEQARLERHLDRLREHTDALAEAGVEPDMLEALNFAVKNVADELENLGGIVQNRLNVTARKSSAVASLAQAHRNLDEALEPIIDDAVFDLIISGENVTADSTSRLTDLVVSGAGLLDQLLMLYAEGNLTAGLIAETMHVDDPALIGPLEERYVSSETAIGRYIAGLPDTEAISDLRRGITRLLSVANAEPNIFERRAEFIALRPEATHLSAADWRQALDELKSAHDDFSRLITEQIDDAAFDLVLATEAATMQSSNALTELIDVGANRVYWALALRSETTLTMGLLNEAATTTHQRTLRPLEERFEASVDHIREALANLSGIPERDRISRASERVVDHGQSDDSVFQLRRLELRHSQAAEAALTTSQIQAAELAKIVRDVVASSEKTSEAAASGSDDAISESGAMLFVFSVASLACAIAVMLFYVRPRVIMPLEDMTAAMAKLADGDVTVDVPCRERSDELGRMAQAAGVFRDTMIELQKSNLREIEDAQRRLSDAIESISEAFSLYDPQDRLVVSNSKYKTLLYPDIAEEITPGMTFEEIVRHAAERGLVKDAEGRVDDWVAERVARHLNPGEPHIQQRSDGTWIMVSERRTQEGGTVAVYSDITELKRREEELASKSKTLEQLSSQLAKYLAPQVYESIFAGRQEVTLSSRRRKLTIFFSDIAGFTETADRLESEDLTDLLNHYLSEMSHIALRHGATIDKYVGDAIVIFFGDPESEGVKQDALNCARMALEMQCRMTELQHVWRKAGVEKPLQIRMGINTGFCTVGNFGSEDRFDYTIIGGGVNLASRLESAARPGEILISYETFALVKDELYCEPRGEIRVKGIAYPVATYSLIGGQAGQTSKLDRVSELLPNFSLSVDWEKMSAAERRETLAVLERTLKKFSGKRS